MSAQASEGHPQAGHDGELSTRRWQKGALSFLVLLIGLALSAPAFAQSIHWQKCRAGQPNTPTKTCVVDGDTIWLDGVNVRMEGYDTPEPHTNICGGAREVELANRATNRLIELLNTRSWRIEFSGRPDRYGREIGTIYIDGRDVGAILVEERLARWWPHGAEWWCG